MILCTMAFTLALLCLTTAVAAGAAAGAFTALVINGLLRMRWRIDDKVSELDTFGTVRWLSARVPHAPPVPTIRGVFFVASAVPPPAIAFKCRSDSVDGSLLRPV